jgi:large subunit ribosomal protein L10
MAVAKAKKSEVLKEVSEKFGKAKAIYFSGYRGINVKKMVALRKKLKQSGVDYAIVKKTLLQIAAKENNMPAIPADIMKGPVAAVFGYDDVIVPAKVLYEFSKDAEQIELLGGLIDGKYMNKSQAVELAQLPSRTELLAKLVGTLKAPISGLHAVMSGVLRSFVLAMAAVRDKKGA